MKIPRKLYYSIYKKRLINKSPTIISSDCLGGIIYHNLGLEFKSPTINLYFGKEDFFEFVRNLRGYLESEIIEVKDSEKPFPVGELMYNDKKITVNFMHYANFDEAKTKWVERKKRVDFSNIYVTQIIRDASEKDITAFDNLPYKKKLLITSDNPVNSENVKIHKVLRKETYRPGEIIEYKNALSVKRYIDDIDYVKFLNQ